MTGMARLLQSVRTGHSDQQVSTSPLQPAKDTTVPVVILHQLVQLKTMSCYLVILVSSSTVLYR